MKKEKSFNVTYLVIGIMATIFLTMAIMLGFWTAVGIWTLAIFVLLAILSGVSVFADKIRADKGKKRLMLINASGITDVICDNPKCDYKIVVPDSNVSMLVDAKCPKCGKVLLTEKDYRLWVRFFKVAALINFFFGWTAIFYDESDRTSAQVGASGGKLNIEKSEK